MDVKQRNTAALQARTNKVMADLVKRFENIVALAAPDKTDFNSTANKKFQIEVETAQLIKTTEEILTLTRQMQELWLFGQLSTLDSDPGSGKMEEDAKAMVALVEALVKEHL